MTALIALRNLLGLQIVSAAHSADMREFGFRHPGNRKDLTEDDWFLHILCSWRIESDEAIITGSFDWNEPVKLDADPGEGWDPAQGGSLQEEKLRALFHDNSSSRSIENKTNLLLVEDVQVDSFGDAVLKITENLRLRVFPAGSRGEFWRIFKKGDLGSHFVYESVLDPEIR